MAVWFVGAGPGDPDLLTVKARRLLEQARCCIWAGSLVNPHILELVPVGCAVYDSAGLNLHEIIEVIRRHHSLGEDIVRLHTGEPSIFGAIAEQQERLSELGIPWKVVPGISAFQAAAASVGCELTIPEVSQSVIICRQPGRTPVPAGQEPVNLAKTGATLCIYLSAQDMTQIAQELSAVLGSDCPALLVYHASWPDEKSLRCTLATLPEIAKGISRTAVLLVGRALAGTGGRVSKLYDSTFSHGYRVAEPAAEYNSSDPVATTKPAKKGSSSSGRRRKVPPLEPS